MVLDKIQETLAEQSAKAVGTNLSFDKLCRAKGVPFQLSNEYYTFLMGLTKGGKPRFSPEDIPRGRGRYIRTGLVIPEPYGKVWRELVESRNIIRGRNKMHIIEAESAELMRRSCEQAMQDAKSAQALAAHTMRLPLAVSSVSYKAGNRTANNVAKGKDSGLQKLPPKSISDEGFTCKQCIKDQCLFCFTHKGKRAWMQIHTDDGEICGEDDGINNAIFERINSMWPSKLTDVEFLLGVKRKLTHGDEGMVVELSMGSYIDAMETAFSECVLKKACPTPLPDKLFLHKTTAADKGEAQQVLNKGYRQLLGRLLWLARMTMHELLFGVSMCGKFMSAPTNESWKALCHMLTYAVQHRNQVLRFSSQGNTRPLCYTDASNKHCSSDGKCQYGVVILWMSGPIVCTSKRLTHVGLSSAINEYQALSWGARSIMFVRDLLTEMGVDDISIATKRDGVLMHHATTLLADNIAANIMDNDSPSTQRYLLMCWIQ